MLITSHGRERGDVDGLWVNLTCHGAKPLLHVRKVALLAAVRGPHGLDPVDGADDLWGRDEPGLCGVGAIVGR